MNVPTAANRYNPENCTEMFANPARGGPTASWTLNTARPLRFVKIFFLIVIYI
jgi:hypothetical protein